MAKVQDHKVRAIAEIADRMTRAMPDHPVARSLQAEVKRLSTGAAALERVNASRSPLETQAAHAVKVAKMARAFDREITAFLNRTASISAGGREDVERRIGEKANLRPPSFEEAKEIREVFRSLKRQEKLALLKTLIEGGRGAELAAITKASELTSGLSDEERANYEKAFVSKRAGAELKEMENLDEVLSAALTASGTAAKLVQELTDPGYLARVEREAAEADEAGAAFNQSIAPPAA